jgi:hypothetical protein
MATLDSSNILDGNTIEPTDILQLYDAFTPGGGTTGEYNVTVSGSLIGNASTATSASYALTASISTTASYALSSSYAVTASYALNGGGGTVTQVNSQGYSNQGGSLIEATFKFYAGTVKIGGGTGITSNLTGLAGKTLGTNVWVTATLEGDSVQYGTGSIYVRGLSAGGAITFNTVNAPNNSIAHYHVIYIPS